MYAGMREPVEERGLAGVGVAHERYRIDVRPLARPALNRPLRLHAHELLLERSHALAEQPPVGLELRLARSAQADAAFLPLQVSPAAHQARRQALELGELDLHFSFVAARTLRENVEDQARAIDHTAVQALLEITLLYGRQIVVENGERRLSSGNRVGDLLDFALTREERRIRTIAAAAHDRERTHAGACRELLRFRQAFRVVGLAEIETHQDGRNARRWTFCHQTRMTRAINYPRSGLPGN